MKQKYGDFIGFQVTEMEIDFTERWTNLEGFQQQRWGILWKLYQQKIDIWVCQKGLGIYPQQHMVILCHIHLEK